MTRAGPLLRTPRAGSARPAPGAPAEGCAGRAAAAQATAAWRPAAARRSRVNAAVQVGRRPQALAPLDDGSGAIETGPRLLLALPNLPRVWLRIQAGGRSWTGQGRVVAERRSAGALAVGIGGWSVDVDPRRVVAITYCADAAASGVCLYDDVSALLTVWCVDAPAFDAWLVDVVPGFVCRVARSPAAPAGPR